MHWDIFCRVVDNYGDIGTCWRLARQLAAEYRFDVRLWVDDLQSFSRLCPPVVSDVSEQQINSIEIRHWPSEFPETEAADVVIEAFACELPENYLAAMGRRPVAPVWFNLEYLSAEDWVDDCHLLASPRSNSNLSKHFFFPGFTNKTGGLLRERDLLTTRAAFNSVAADEFWRSLDIPPQTTDELRISLFCYENPALFDLLQAWAAGPIAIRLFTTPGPATRQVANWFGCELFPGAPIRRNSLTVHALPFLPQPDFDRLLWACDVNFVRGEDSFVRAQWAQKPFIWQIYPQDEDAHLIKLEAFLARYLENSLDSSSVRRFWQAWNSAGDIAAAWPDFLAKRHSLEQHGKVWASQLDQAENLANNLNSFVCNIGEIRRRP